MKKNLSVRTRHVVSLTAAVLISISAFGQAKEKKAKDKFLAGKVFTIELTQVGAKKTTVESDDISFKSEKLNSKFMTTENKFTAAPYTAEMDSSDEDKVISFEATGKNQDGEELLWSGTVTGEEIEGTAQISKKGKTKKEYSFTGTLKAKKK